MIHTPTKEDLMNPQTTMLIWGVDPWKYALLTIDRMGATADAFIRDTGVTLWRQAEWIDN